MTADALALLLCLIKPVFSYPEKWTPNQCQEHAQYIIMASDKHRVSPLLVTALNIQECSLQSNVVRNWRKHNQIGVDACPGGIRIYGHFNRNEWPNSRLYMESARLLKRKGLHHYNHGNPTYSTQVLAFLATLEGWKVREEDKSKWTKRTREIVRRLNKVLKRIN